MLSQLKSSIEFPLEIEKLTLKFVRTSQANFEKEQRVNTKLYETSTTLTPKPNKDVKGKEMILTCLMNRDAKIFSK